MDSGHTAVYKTNEAYMLHKENSPEVLYIDRSISTIEKRKIEKSLSGVPTTCFGVLGILSLQASNYLVVITKASHIARIKENYIYKIAEIDFLPYTSLMLESKDLKTDERAKNLIKTLISTKSFYFSYTYDLTLSIQKISTLSGPAKQQNRWERADGKFFWNKFLCESLIKAEAHDFILPVINGFVKAEYVTIGIRNFDYILISRRDKRRTGTRFNTRGLDDQGNSVNFVETEQILSYWEENHFHIFSYVQIRGSIPLVWQQKPNLAWMPKLKLSNSAHQNTAAAELHFSELYSNYGEISLINLIDKKGSQKIIGTAFSNLAELQACNQLSYVWFDFHHECKNMKYENLKYLLKEVNKQLESFGWCQVIVNGSDYIDKASIVSKQLGAFRTNCMDCLDRTNVVQSVFARNVLLRQLARNKLGPEPNGEAFQGFSGSLEQAFRNLWVSNADFMSILYSGTPAQKTDFTRLGKRTVMGGVYDGVYSCQRYVINNFLDGSNQNSFDLFLGRISLKNHIDIDWKYKSLVRFLVIFFVALAVSWTVASKLDGLGFYVLFVISLALFLNLVAAYGRVFVDHPISSNN